MRVLPSSGQAPQVSETVTGQDGVFTFGPIAPGHYVLEASLLGAKSVRANLTLHDGQQGKLDITVPLLAIEERVTATHATAEQAPRESVGSPAGAAGCSDPRSTDCLEPPVLVLRVAPRYPTEISNIDGSAVLAARITSDGSLASLHILSADRPEFAKAATAALSQWKFQPARLNRKPISTAVTVTAEFRAE